MSVICFVQAAEKWRSHSFANSILRALLPRTTIRPVCPKTRSARGTRSRNPRYSQMIGRHDYSSVNGTANQSQAGTVAILSVRSGIMRSSSCQVEFGFELQRADPHIGTLL